MFKKLSTMVLALCVGVAVSEEITKEQQEIIQDQMLEEFAKIIFSQKMSLFSRPQNPKIRDLTDLAMCPSLTAQIHQNPSKSEDLMLVEKIDLEDKKSPRIENFIFCFFNFHISWKKC